MRNPLTKESIAQCAEELRKSKREYEKLREFIGTPSANYEGIPNLARHNCYERGLTWSVEYQRFL